MPLHRVAILMKCFVVWTASEACLQVGFTGDAQLFSPLRSFPT